jgi:hypothetical protein
MSIALPLVGTLWMLLLFVSASISRNTMFLLKEADTKRRRSIHGVPTKGSGYKEKHPWCSYSMDASSSLCISFL